VNEWKECCSAGAQRPIGAADYAVAVQSGREPGSSGWLVHVGRMTMEQRMTRHCHDPHLRSSDDSGRGELRHVSPDASRVYPDRFSHDGAEHQNIWFDDARALDGGRISSHRIFRS
jgi:hypothetical protein